MTSADWINLGIFCTSVVALIVSIVTAVWSVKANRQSLARADEANRVAGEANQFSRQANTLSQEANALAAGDAETAMIAIINSAWEQVNRVRGDLDLILQGRSKSKLSAEDQRRIEGIEKGLRFAIERVCDSYEVCCGRYLDGKCDKERFKKLFCDSIRQLVENDTDSFKHVLRPGPASKFKAILKVYDDWHNLEK